MRTTQNAVWTVEEAGYDPDVAGNELESSEVRAAAIVAAVAAVVTVMLLFLAGSSNGVPNQTPSAPPAAEVAPG